jgi:hypothetical protein
MDFPHPDIRVRFGPTIVEDGVGMKRKDGGIDIP